VAQPLRCGAVILDVGAKVETDSKIRYDKTSEAMNFIHFINIIY
jgi:hypothetical protein